MQLISTQGGVVGGLLLPREESSTNYQFLLDHTNYFERFFD